MDSGLLQCCRRSSCHQTLLSMFRKITRKISMSLDYAALLLTSYRGTILNRAAYRRRTRHVCHLLSCTFCLSFPPLPLFPAIPNVLHWRWPVSGDQRLRILIAPQSAVVVPLSILLAALANPDRFMVSYTSCHNINFFS